MQEWTNWAGNVIATPREMATPDTIDQLRRLVADATAKGDSIRVAGSGHSFSPVCETDGLLLDLSNIAGVETIDPENGDVTVMAGSKIHDLGEPLFAAGRAFANQGDIDRQAIAGAVATGTHGTGRQYGSFSNAVRAVEFVTANGDLVWIDGDSPEVQQQAVALSLGTFGVVTRLRLATVPAYKLREHTEAMSFEECMGRYPSIEATHRNAEFWWIPPLDMCVLKSFAETDEAPFAVAEVEHSPGTIERYLKPDKVDWSYRVFPSTRALAFVECEYTIPIENGPAAMRGIRAVMQLRHPDIRWGVEYRTMAGESHHLSPTQGRDCVTISVHQAANQEFEPFMRDAEAIFLSYGGRPHWGKLHWLPRAGVEYLYPEVDAFRRVRAEFDPAGVFLNNHLREFFE